jgi:replicative DNA helicase
MKQNSNMHYDLNAEAAILSAMMIDSYAASQVITEMEADYFYRGAHKIIYNTMLDMYRRNVGIDMLTLISELKRTDKLDRVGGEAFINDLSDMVMTAANMKEHMRIVKKHYITRQVLIQAETIINMPGQGVVGDELLEQARQNLYNISASKSNSMRHISSVMADTMQNKEMIATGKKNRLYFKFGVPAFDNVLKFEKGGLCIVCMPSSHGKSALVQQAVIENAKRGARVLYFSLEMEEEQLLDRAIAYESKLTHDMAQNPNMDELASYTETCDRMHDLPIWIDTTPGITWEYVKAAAQRLIYEVGGIDLIAIDYVQIATAPKADTRQQQLAELTKLMKVGAKEMNVGVISPAQANRTGQVREADDIRQNADVMLFGFNPGIEKLHKYTFCGEDILDFDNTDVFWWTVKNRNGKHLSARIKFDGDHQRFYEIYEEV